MKCSQYPLLPKLHPHLPVIQPALIKRIWGPSHRDITVPSSAEEILQNTHVHSLRIDRPTNGQPSGRPATCPRELNIIFKPHKANRMLCLFGPKILLKTLLRSVSCVVQEDKNSFSPPPTYYCNFHRGKITSSRTSHF